MNKGQFRLKKKSQKDYSLAFKLQVVDEVEKGVLTQTEAHLKYGIQGKSTVLVWLRKHGCLDWSSKARKMGKPSPNKKIKELEKKIKRLEQEKIILNKAIDVADELYDTNIRKKFLPLSQASSVDQGHQESEVPET